MLALAGRAPSGRVVKPATVVRGQACRLPWAWDSLCFGVPLNQYSVDGFRDIASGAASNGVRQEVSPYALDTDWFFGRDDGGNPSPQLHSLQFADWPNNPRHYEPSTELTAYVRARRTATCDNDGGYLCYPYQEAGPPWETWGILSSGVGTNAVYGTITLGTTQYTLVDTAVIPTTEFVSMFFRWRSGEAPRVDIYGVKGDLLSSVVHGSTLSGSIGYLTGQTMRLNAASYRTGNANARYSQAMFWSRRLADAEVVSLVADPFGWYSPPRETTTVAGAYPLFGGHPILRLAPG